MDRGVMGHDLFAIPVPEPTHHALQVPLHHSLLLGEQQGQGYSIYAYPIPPPHYNRAKVTAQMRRFMLTCADGGLGPCTGIGASL